MQCLWFALASITFSEAVPNLMMHEISARPWLYSMAQAGIPAHCGGGQYVCLKDVPESEWQQLADMHVEMVWLMGVWQVGAYGPSLDKDHIDQFRPDLPDVRADDIIGSPYAIKGYKVNTEIGTDEDLASVRKTLHALGIKLMLDFVPNHGAVDSVLVAQSPGIFVQKPSNYQGHSDWWIDRAGYTFAYGRGPYDGPWMDTLQYNYWSPQTVEVMTNYLESVASKADAVRCDMAHLVLNDVIQRTWQDAGVISSRPSEEFWKVAINATRAKYPDTIFLAEAYDYHMTSPPEKRKLLELGFDFVYDKDILDKLIDQRNLHDLKAYISSESQDFFRHMAHFVENHDEKRAVFNLQGKQQAFTGAVVAFTLPGMRFSFEGQFQGFRNKLDVQLRRAAAEPTDSALVEQYKSLLSIISNDVFHAGQWTNIFVPEGGSGWRICAWRWASKDGNTKRLVVVNYSDQDGFANVPVADVANGSSDQITITELLSGNVYVRSVNQMRSPGLSVVLKPFTSQIFQYDASALQSTDIIV